MVKLPLNTVTRYRFETILLQQQTITKKQCTLILETFPIFETNREFRYMFIHLATSNQIDEQDGGILVTCQQLAMFLGKDRKNCNTEKEMLIPYQQQVSPDMTYRNYYHQGQKCRMIINSGVPRLLREALLQQGGEKVYLHDLKPVTIRRMEDSRRKLQKTAQVWDWQYPIQKKITSYLHALPLRLFMTDRMDEAYRTALLMENAEYHIKALRKIEGMPMPFYYPSSDPKSRTPRIFGTALQYLSKDIRKVLFPDWLDLDLKSCQLAITGGIFEIGSVQAFLRSGKSIWNELLTYMECPDDKRKQMKEHIKVAVYSIIFGMRKGNVELELSKSLAEIGIQKVKNITNHPLLKDLLEALIIARVQVKNAKGMQSAFGWMELRPGEDIDSFISNCIQTYEIALIGACYDLILKQQESNNCECDIPLHQHDGICIVLRKGHTREKVFKKLNKAVIEKAAEFGIITELEVS